jgi:hypothetical protein
MLWCAELVKEAPSCSDSHIGSMLPIPICISAFSFGKPVFRTLLEVPLNSIVHGSLIIFGYLFVSSLQVRQWKLLGYDL